MIPKNGPPQPSTCGPRSGMAITGGPLLTTDSPTSFYHKSTCIICISTVAIRECNNSV